MSYQILSEKYSELTVDVTAVDNDPADNYSVSIYARRNGESVLLWREEFDEQERSIHTGIELTMANLILASKTGIVTDDQEPWEDYLWVRDTVLRTAGTSIFAMRFNSSHEVSRSVFHTGQRICYPAKVEIIGKPVDLEIYVRIPHDPLSALPTYYLKFTVVDDSEEARRDGMTLTTSRRTCCFNYTGSELRFDENEIIDTFKEELIVALGLEG